jgi:beta-glucosidase
LGGFAKVELGAGETQLISLAVDPRLLAMWSLEKNGWVRDAGSYQVSIGESSREIVETVSIDLPSSYLSPQWRPQ